MINRRTLYLFTPKKLYSLCFLLICAGLFYLLYINFENNQVNFYKRYYPDIQSIFRLRRPRIDLKDEISNEKEYIVLTQTESQITTEKSVEKIENEFRLKTKGCKIKALPLLDSEIIKLFKNKSETLLKCKSNLIHIKRFDETFIHLNWSQLEYKPFCYYRELSRGSDDFHFKYGVFSGPIEDSTINFPNHHFVQIICYKNSAEKLFFENFNPKDKDLIHNEIIPLIPRIEKSSESDAPNILLMAIDSISYINFQRHFIRTKRFLEKNNFFELKGYTKVGLNTFPNMIPFFTGHHYWELISVKDLMKTKFDSWPIIWKNYSEKGFVTAFVEEMGLYGLFQFKGQGFVNKPTDYETRPFHMEIRPQKYKEFCYVDRTETQHSLDFTYDFIKAMNKRQQKYFAYISISEMSHDWFNGGHYLDVPYYQLFTKLFDENLVKNTFILFFSDHGLRLGPIRKTKTGKAENRLPFIFIYLPENTNQKYVENLKENQNRLTTPFDNHATLLHLINGEADRTLPHGLSLIDSVISEDRDCERAAIPDQFCSCYEDIAVHDFNLIKPNETIPKIVAKINWYSEEFRSKCVEFEFDSISNIYTRKLTRTTTEDPSLNDSKLYIIQLYVKPGKALFETLVKGYDQNTRFEVINEMIRINTYGSQADCITNKIVKNYCFCKNLLKDLIQN